MYGRTGAREVRVEVQPALDRRARRRFLGIPRQQAENVVAAAVPRLHHQAEIGRQGAVVGRPRRLVVLVRRRDVVAQFAGPLLDLAFVVGIGVVFVFFSYGFHLVDGVAGADEGAPGYAAEGVAGGTDFAVDLEAAAEAGEIY